MHVRSQFHHLIKVVRHTLVNHYQNSMVDHKEYDKKLYPHNVKALSADFEPEWKDETLE
jgi:hypothetical protein